jgi:hypothetical protein
MLKSSLVVSATYQTNQGSPPLPSTPPVTSPASNNTVPSDTAAISEPTQTVGHLLSASLALVLIGLIASTMRFWQPNGPLLLPSGSYAFIPAFCLSALAAVLVLRAKAPFRLSDLRITPQGSAAGLLIIFASDWFDRSYNFFPSPFVRGEIVFFGALFLLLPALWQERSLRALLPLTALCLAAIFMAESNGRLLYSDDHPSFFFRLSMLKERFPWIPFYYPMWNGGLDARDFFATGSLSGFLLFAPLIYLFDLQDTYNIIIGLILFALLPLSIYAASALEGWDKTSRAIAATLAICCGLVWYRWALKYGTTGFIISAALVPLNLTLAAQLLRVSPQVSFAKVLIFVATTTLMLFWSASALVFMPLAAFIVCSVLFRLTQGIRPVLQSRTLLAAVLLIALNVPWMTLFWSVSNVGRFLSRDSAVASQTAQFAESARPSTPSGFGSSSSGGDGIQPLPQAGEHRGFRHRDGSLDLGKSLGIVREKTFSTNPLILLFTLPGIFFLRPRPRTLLVLTGVWLAFLGSVMVPLKPQLELDRMLLILTLAATIPAGAALRDLLLTETSLPRGISALVKGLSAGILFASPFCSAAVLSNRTVEQYHFADPLVQHLAEAIRTLGGTGRTVFSGCIVHELEEGHIAPLTLFSGKEIVASAPFHTLWKYTQVIPKSFIERGDAGIEEYLSIMNATSVVAHEREWRDYFSARPEKYALRWREDRFSLFERKAFESSPFLDGAGALLERTTHSLRFRIDSPSATLKYNYFPFLQTSGCKIGPAEVAPEIRFIALTGCEPGTEVTIEASAPWRRVLK